LLALRAAHIVSLVSQELFSRCHSDTGWRCATVHSSSLSSNRIVESSVVLAVIIGNYSRPASP